MSSTDFDVAGWKVTTRSTTEYSFGTAADLALDKRVALQGSVDAGGVAAAASLRFRPLDAIRIVSEVKSIDLDNRRLTAMGVTATTGAATASRIARTPVSGLSASPTSTQATGWSYGDTSTRRARARSRRRGSCG